MAKSGPPRTEKTRRKTDGRQPATKAAVRAATPARALPNGKPGGRLRAEVVLPVGVGAVVMCAAFGIVAVASEKMGVPLPLTLTVAGLVLTAGLVAYLAWGPGGAGTRPPPRRRGALQEVGG